MPSYQGPALWHLGYIKTGSSFLQWSVFDQDDGPFGLAGGAQNRWHLMDMLRTRNDYTFDAAGHAARLAALEQPLRAAGKIPVWSDETLLGNPLRRAYCGPDVLGRLQQISPNARFLITIREQKAFALSSFRQAAAFHRYRLTDFIGTGTEEPAKRPVLRPEFMEYHHAVAAYQAAFGPENVGVMPLEMLARDQQTYLERLCALMDISAPLTVDATPRNVGRGATAIAASRYLNGLFEPSVLSHHKSLSQRLVSRGKVAIDRLAPKPLDARIETRWKAQIAARYQGVFEDSNAQLAPMTGLDLKAYGYV